MIHQTIIKCSSLDPDVLQALYEHGATSKQDADLIAEAREEWETECEARAVAAQEAGTDCVLEDFVPPRVMIAGRYQHIQYQIWPAGGVMHLLVIESACVGHFSIGPIGLCDGGARLAGGPIGYDVWPSWHRREPPDGLNFFERMVQHEQG